MGEISSLEETKKYPYESICCSECIHNKLDTYEISRCIIYKVRINHPEYKYCLGLESSMEERW